MELLQAKGLGWVNEGVEKKWNLVKEFYETNYKCTFRRVPKAHEILFLYEQMELLRVSLRKHREAASRYLDQFCRSPM